MTPNELSREGEARFEPHAAGVKSASSAKASHG